MSRIAADSVPKRPRRKPVATPPISRSKLALAIATALSAADASADSTLEEVIVTARKRTENLQDVPIGMWGGGRVTRITTRHRSTAILLPTEIYS